MECVWQINVTITGLGTSESTAGGEAILMIATGSSATNATQNLTGGSYNIFATATHLGSQQTFYLKDSNATLANPYVKLSVFRPGVGMQIYGSSTSRLSTASTFTISCACTQIGSCQTNKIITINKINEMYPIINTYFGTGNMYRTYIGISWGGLSNSAYASLNRIKNNNYTNKFIAINNGQAVSDNRYYVSYGKIAMSTIATSNATRTHPGYTLTKSGSPVLMIDNNLSEQIQILYAYVTIYDSAGTLLQHEYFYLPGNPTVSANSQKSVTLNFNGSTINGARRANVTVIGFYTNITSSVNVTTTTLGNTTNFKTITNQFNINYDITLNSSYTISGTAMTISIYA